MREPKTPEEFALRDLQKEWISHANKIFRSSDSLLVHVPAKEHYFITLKRLVPVIDSLKLQPIIDVYRLSRKDLKSLRTDHNIRYEAASYIQFGEVRVEDTHWEPIVASFELTPVRFQEAKNELDRCQFIAEEVESNPNSARSKRSGGSIDEELVEAEAVLAKWSNIPGFLNFNTSGLLLEKPFILDRIF